jgi:hypothetical protein
LEVVVADPVKRGRGRPLGSNKAVTEQRVRELNARQRAFVLWSATPLVDREPKTLKELGEVLGVSGVAMWKWSKDPRVVEAIRFVSLQNAGDPIKVRAILDMVYEVALSKKDVRYAEVWMKATGVMSQFGRSADLLSQADDAEVDAFADYSLEELQALRSEALAANMEQVVIELAERKLASGEAANDALEAS